MQVNWPLVIVLFSLALPGVLIAIPRLINMLLKENSEHLKKRVGRFAIGQTLLMVLLMSFAGTVLSPKTGLNAPLLESMLQAAPFLIQAQESLLPVLLYTIVGLLGFFILYYGLAASILDEQTLQNMHKVRAALGLDGCILYGGVVEEIITRWGLMNVIAFFAILFSGRNNAYVIWTAILLSGLFISLGQLPAYIAAGCQSSRRFIYSMLLLNGWQAALFGWLFWQYGLLAAIVAHMLFHLGWSIYDKA
ncbi:MULTISPECIES: CPBP family intramembrane metalloprotease [unclassified Legionella]|uniref:CPBP family intramembrane metalloprotease n=1 Tax=unclassified Legionella TaxID=2622702 RepID=UPI001056A43E|nr:MULTISPECIES: CPBP family intramembrane metalloprotease [unclassified Legionella]MDI9818500.1 CPBP family intramembrane metalloprotease [Legionella sp. PL877]